jgi:hypothetical protein
LPSTVLMYLGWLSTEDKVHAGSLQPYLSAINQCHIDFGFAAPALGHDVCLSRKAFGYVEGQHTLKTAQRGTMPSLVMLQILHLGLRTPCIHTLRRCACLVTQFAWFCRSDTSMQLRRAHITFQARGIGLNERTKTVPRCNAAPIFRTGDAASDAGSLVLRLLLRWELQHPHASHDLFWSTSEDSYSPSAWGTSLVNTWLQEILSLLHLSPPAGETWTSHSLRRGGASACFAINVQPLVIASYGCWKSTETLMTYIDVLTRPDAAARLFFGHLRPAHECVPPASMVIRRWRDPICGIHHLCASPVELTSEDAPVTLLSDLSVKTVRATDLSAAREPSVLDLLARLPSP